MTLCDITRRRFEFRTEARFKDHSMVWSSPQGSKIEGKYRQIEVTSLSVITRATVMSLSDVTYFGGPDAHDQSNPVSPLRWP